VRALRSAFQRAEERGFASVSFPAVSSGIFAVPLETCARAYVSAVRGFFAAPATRLTSLRLVLRPGPIVDLVSREMGRPG
jgi:O-acetyl-ADP-ribose deacetylase (regulator of RNase III)